jgi:hypothetical protein
MDHIPDLRNSGLIRPIFSLLLVFAVGCAGPVKIPKIYAPAEGKAQLVKFPKAKSGELAQSDNYFWFRDFKLCRVDGIRWADAKMTKPVSMSPGEHRIIVEGDGGCTDDEDSSASTGHYVAHGIGFGLIGLAVAANTAPDHERALLEIQFPAEVGKTYLLRPLLGAHPTDPWAEVVEATKLTPVGAILRPVHGARATSAPRATNVKAKLETLRELRSEGLITEDEFRAQKQRLLGEL